LTEINQRAAPGRQENDISGKIIGAAIEVHKYLGPGLLESAYEECLCCELDLKGNQIPATGASAIEL
jgi:GxxExxY protein